MPSTLSKILHPRRTRQREEFVSGSSLGSSLDISNRLSEVLFDHSGPLSMKFHKGWRHSNCPVEKWYQKQTEWSTKFTSIEHMRELQAPFHHEYLLIHLEDGAICRVERMGEGARADAIRRMGCIAHDIIQRFPKGEYDNNLLSKVASERVALVEFPRTFDLLDVLAVCYSLQQVKRSSVYTLQRYNCYFLCLAVLSVLARRVAGWHVITGRTSWPSTIKNTVYHLQAMECNDAYEYFGVGICSLLDLDSLNPRKFILDSIERQLSEQGLSSLDSAISDTLWHKDLGYVAHIGLEDDISHAVNRALDRTNDGARTMEQLLAGEVPEEIKVSMPSSFLRDFRIIAYNSIARSIRISANSAATTYSMREVEDPTPLSHRLRYHYSAMKEVIKLVRGVEGIYNIHFKFGEMPFVTQVWLATRIFPVLLAQERIDSYDYDENEIEEFTEQSAKHAIFIGMYEAIQAPICDTRDKIMVALSDVEFDREDWVRSLSVCVGRQIEDFVHQQCKPVGNIAVHFSKSDSSCAVHMTVAEFQEHTIKRIQAHASRVSAFGLAAAKLVQNEIETTITEVWKKMPDREDCDWGWAEAQSGESEDNIVHSDWKGLMEDYGLSGLFLLD